MTTTSSVIFVITASLETHDTDSMHVTSGAARSRLVARTPGIYAIHGQIEFDTNSAGDRYGDIYKDDATAIAKTRIPAAGSGPTRLPVQSTYPMERDSFVELRGFQNSGGSLDILAGEGETYFEMYWVAPLP